MLRRILGSPSRYKAQAALSKIRHKGWHSPNGTTFAKDARPSEITELFDEIKQMRGWFTYDDTAAFVLCLRQQSALGIRGDVLEIGSYHGRSTSALVRGLRDGEAVTVCDPMELLFPDDPNAPNAGLVRANVAKANPGMNPDSLKIFNVLSKDLNLDGQTFRFIHVDGSHTHDDALLDLRLAREHLIRGGVIVVDDYDHPDWPGVVTAVAEFRAENPDLVELADLNRHAESGRKLYLALPA